MQALPARADVKALARQMAGEARSEARMGATDATAKTLSVATIGLDARKAAAHHLRE